MTIEGYFKGLKGKKFDTDPERTYTISMTDPCVNALVRVLLGSEATTTSRNETGVSIKPHFVSDNNNCRVKIACVPPEDSTTSPNFCDFFVEEQDMLYMRTEDTEKYADGIYQITFTGYIEGYQANGERQ